MGQLFKHRLYFANLPPSNRGILWIPFKTNHHKKLTKKLIPFLMAWLHRGPIFEYNSGLLIISYFPSKLDKKFINQMHLFFNSFDLEIVFFINTNISELSSLSIYHLPASKFYNTEKKSWNLSRQEYFPNIKDKIRIINSIVINEQKS